MAGPTAFPDLNAVLDELVAGVQTILGASFCGAYLQGSFAVGDADEHSDVDFVVVIEEELTDTQVGSLQELHARLFALPTPWAQHLEGSYITRELLRHVDTSRTPLFYLDNGASELIWDSHCNTAVVRWSLREHGVVLAGLEPKTLVDPVTAAELRAEIVAGLPEWWDYARLPTKAGSMSRWLQPYVVVSFCRMLHTFTLGRVASKRESGEWALGALDPEWVPLIRRALDDRPDPWERVYQPAAPEDAKSTLAFVDYAIELIRSSATP